MSEMNHLSPQENDARTQALIACVLMITGLFTGIFWLVGGIWAWIARGDARGTRFDGHYRNLLKVFVWGSVWTLVGTVLAMVFVGWLVLLVVWVWAAWRLTRSLLRLVNGRPYDDF
ncbi:DUF4870 family protein [Parathalassolituus penaei]|uniref:Transmembrane protein n=1 Tax=Parathalassolituus penaei TaxID=2997323 RepID=A0A9X3ISL2_9GAMM|nr:DUF4870 domain-containing protein [Parathalassolituus penaei]MCY0966517.1 hypothetical protein [Parathalassolituus penaei]